MMVVYDINVAIGTIQDQQVQASSDFLLDGYTN